MGRKRSNMSIKSKILETGHRKRTRFAIGKIAKQAKPPSTTRTEERMEFTPTTAIAISGLQSPALRKLTQSVADIYRILSVSDNVSELQIAVASGHILHAHRGSQLVEPTPPVRTRVKIRAMENAFREFVNSPEVDNYLNFLNIPKNKRHWLFSQTHGIFWDLCSARVNTKVWRTADHVDEYAYQQDNVHKKILTLWVNGGTVRFDEKKQRNVLRKESNRTLVVQKEAEKGHIQDGRCLPDNHRFGRSEVMFHPTPEFGNAFMFGQYVPHGLSHPLKTSHRFSPQDLSVRFDLRMEILE